MTAPDFVKRQFVGERAGYPLHRQLCEYMKELGATWMRFTYLPEKDQIVVEGWQVRPEDEGPEPT